MSIGLGFNLSVHFGIPFVFEIDRSALSDAPGEIVLVYKVGSGTSYIYYYLRNAQGDIVKLIDSSGNTVVEYLHQAGVSPLGA